MTDKCKQLNIGQEIISGTQDVFSTMLMLEVAAEDVSDQKANVITSNLTSMIGLGGGVRGMLAVHCPAEVAQFITGSFLGMDVEELDEDVKDAIGEIVNMIAGNLKVSYADAGINVELAIPTSVVGNGFRVSGASGSIRHNISFQLDSGTFWVELLYVLS